MSRAVGWAPPQMKCLLIGLLATAASYAQPKINAVIGAASSINLITFNVRGGFTTGGLAVDGLATIFGSGLATGQAQASSTPWPGKLGDTEVFICPLTAGCKRGGLLYVSPTQINFQIPNVVVGGYFNFQVRVAGVDDVDTASNRSWNLGINSSSPAIFFAGYDCLIDARYQNRDPNCGLTSQKGTALQARRGAITDTAGRLLTSSNPAKLGDYYTIWLTGLGEIVNGAPVDRLLYMMTNIPDSPNNYNSIGYVQQFTPSYVGMSPEFPGLYQINFQLPIEIATGFHLSIPTPPWPCGDYQWEIGVYVDGGSSVAMNIPIQIHNGDVPCSP